MKIDPFRQTDDTPPEDRKRRRRERDEPDAPPVKDEAPRKWAEREGFFQGAKVRRR